MASGPAPKDESARLGHGSISHEDPRYLTKSTAAFKPVPVIPEADPKWHAVVRSWYNSLKVSGQADLFQASDWTLAVMAAQAYDRFLRTDNASILQSFVRLSERLGCTVIDRKKARIELTHGETVDHDQQRASAAVVKWRGHLGAVRDDPGP